MASPSRFDRDYELAIQVGTDKAVIVRPPIRIAFDVEKSVAGGLNKATVQVYNLEESNRLALVKDAESPKRIPLSLRVGYSGELRLLFKGTVHRGQNSREGADMVTELECLDGGFDLLNSFTSATVRGGQRAVDQILDDMPNTTPGKINTRPPLIRPRVLVGASAKIIDDLLGEDETWFIDGEQLYIMRRDQVAGSFVPVVRAGTGLLNTPTREQSKVTFESLINPTLKIGGLCQLISNTAPHLNGVYKITEMGYYGDNYGAEWGQSVTGFLAGGYEVIR